jgi:hypothetical protein
VTGDHDDDADLAAQWADQLRRTGGVQVRYTNDEDLTRYRRTGHDAGKLLERSVQTVARDGVLHVTLTDWGENPLESRLEDARTRNAIDKAFRAHPER